ncbi:hypothetical protein H012_gp417 [Acanthamoeba polyphaga moumouvirus]|uniref:Uncharacterized protein n=1 Tax=Acanthamoeba polyphaga moumouvirus TaxID=1269028 RepID=L7RCM5_9VIRU|nr:hypothetical protein H012_gp417 [Acanthamoeba polyphaga moumouvirus]AGC02042.1 hypothetical protein Moumou_00508 [Acanthamoeba polyphaga moumouvirus]AQN68407.1 hypothetical protein [Saudi moumouvirus]
MSEEKEVTNNNIMDEYYIEEEQKNYHNEHCDDILEQISQDSNNISDFIKAHISNYNEPSKNIIDENLEKFKPVTYSFITWMRENKNNDNLYKSFSDIFSSEYRTSLYENIIKYFHNEEVITDEFLIYWKLLIIDIIKNNKRHKHNMEYININLDTQITNLRLDKEKGVFRCLVDNNSICFFKENGNDYYVS